MRFKPFLFTVCLALLLWRQAGAFDQLELSLGSLEAADWRVEGLRFTLDWSDPGATGFRLEMDSLLLPALAQRFEGISAECRQGVIGARVISCTGAEVRLSHPLLDSRPMSLRFTLDRSSGKLSGRLKGVGMMGGSLDLDFELDGGAWQLRARSQALKVGRIAAQWPAVRDLVTGWSLAGRLALDARVAGRGGKLSSARWQGELSGLSLADGGGSYVGEGLRAGFQGKLARSATAWRIEAGLDLGRGELLTPVCYLDAAAHPLRLRGELSLDAGLDTLALRDIQASLAGLLDLRLEGSLRFSAERPLQRLALKVPSFQAGDLYQEMLQPVLAGSPWGRLEPAGKIDLALDLRQQAMDLELGLSDFGLDDAESDDAAKRLGLHGVNGRLFWNRDGKARPSGLAWQGGQLLEHIDIGPGRIDFAAAGGEFRLLRQARIPLLDGTLVVDRLALSDLGQPSQRLEFDGFIEPISMASLSRALGWPPLSGKLSGMLPGLTYEQGLLSVDGVLLVRIFDGDILIRQLQTRDLFGVYPQLKADLELRNLDLESLTDTFSFGRITGRMDGYVRDLSLEDWSPVSFDARFYTPPGDDSRHRISQRAVDNISNLGGAGLSGSLARSFMRFFKEFNYQRIGIGCRLHDGVCDMTGAGEAKQGYYLVQGRGIPRIDIIGYNTTADWSGLVEQLQQITAAGAPEIQ